MKPIAITLQANGKKKRFTAKKELSIAIVLKSLELQQALDSTPSITPENIEIWSDYICAVFGYKFTKRDLQNSIEYIEFLPLVLKIQDYVIEKANLEIPSNNPLGEVVPFENRRKKS